MQQTIQSTQPISASVPGVSSHWFRPFTIHSPFITINKTDEFVSLASVLVIVVLYFCYSCHHVFLRIIHELYPITAQISVVLFNFVVK